MSSSARSGAPAGVPLANRKSRNATLGIVSVVLGILFVVLAGNAAVSVGSLRLMGPMIEVMLAPLRQAFEKEQAAASKFLEERIAKETNADRKARMQAKLDEIAALSPPRFPDMSAMFPTSLVASQLASSIVGGALSVLLIIGGFGLQNDRAWGRTACLAYARISLVVIIVGAMAHVAYVGPDHARSLGEFIRGMMQDSVPPIDPAEIDRQVAAIQTSQSIAGYVQAAFSAVVGGAYPVVLLTLLRKPAA